MTLLFLLAILHRLQLTDISRQQVEDELSLVNKEKADIIEQFQHVRSSSSSSLSLMNRVFFSIQMTRLKNTLAEDLIAAKKDIERLSEHNVRLNKEKEDLTKERGNLVVDLTGTERDNQTLNSVCSFSSSLLLHHLGFV